MTPISSETHDKFNALVRTHYRTLWGYASHLTRNKAQTEDIVHQAFLAAFDRLAKGNDFEGPALAWLRATARNLVCRTWRTQKRLSPRSIDELHNLIADADDASEQAMKQETTAALRLCMEKLGDDDRSLLAHMYEQGETPTSIAEEMQQNVATIRVRLFRIRKSLKTCLERRLLIRGTA